MWYRRGDEEDMAGQQYCLRWNNYQSNMTSVFHHLLRSQAFVDVTLACNEQSLKAHKVVLSACSSYFQKLLMENPCKHPTIIMPQDICFSDLKYIIEFVYKGEIDVSQSQLQSLLKTADQLKIKGLCEVPGSKQCCDADCSRRPVRHRPIKRRLLDYQPPADSAQPDPPPQAPEGQMDAATSTEDKGEICGDECSVNGACCSCPDSVCRISTQPQNPHPDSAHQQMMEEGEVSDCKDNMPVSSSSTLPENQHQESPHQSHDIVHEEIAHIKFETYNSDSEMMSGMRNDSENATNEEFSMQCCPQVKEDHSMQTMMITPELLGLLPSSHNENGSASGSDTVETPKQSKSWTAEDMEAALDALRNQTMSLTKASIHYGIPSTTLWQRAHRLGIDTPKKDGPAKSWTEDNLNVALEALRSGTISANKASKAYGIPSSTLYKIARREGIRLAAPFNAAPTTWNPDDLERALEAIRSGQTTVQKAAADYGIPSGTLYGRCKREGIGLSRSNPNPWSEHAMNDALEAVRMGQMSINQAAIHFNLPYSSLYGRFKRIKYEGNSSSSDPEDHQPSQNSSSQSGQPVMLVQYAGAAPSAPTATPVMYPQHAT